MKLRRNDLTELKKGGISAIQAKLQSLQEETTQTAVDQMKHQLKNLRSPKLLRKSVAQMHTLVTELKEIK